MTIIMPGGEIPPASSNGTSKDLIEDFCSELALASPGSISDAQDDQVRQIVQIANRVGSDLCREFDWQMLINEYSFICESSRTEYDLPSDWLRSIPSTTWDSGKRLPMYGGLSPQSWAAYKAMSLGSGIDLFYRVINGRFVLVADPAAGETVKFEYVSKLWVVAHAGGYSDRITNDNDLLLFDYNLMLEGMLLRWRKTKGLPFDPMDYARLLSQCKSQDVPGRAINLGRRFGNRLIDELNIPPTGFGGV